jgi:hypothetical protein
MSTTYVWKVIEIGTKNAVNNDNEVLNDAIVEVTWKKIGTDINGNFAAYVGTTDLDPTSTTAAAFVALDDVTSSMIVDWLESTISTKEMGIIDDKIAKKIEKQQITRQEFNN